MTERECFEALSDRYLQRAHEAEAAGDLREAYRCICASVYSARRVQELTS